MALIQITVDDEVKRRADEAFARNGITTPMAMRMMVTQVARTNRTPFDDLFTGPTAMDLAEDVRRDMVYAEAQELGIIPEEGSIGSAIPSEILDEFGIDPSEVGQ